MSDEPLRPMYERNIRRAAQGEQLHDLPSSLFPLLAELDRLRAVEKAAAALVERWHNGDFRVGPVGNVMLTDLTDALNGGKP